ncbi:hypothetical protein L9F63_019144, partial [Diploptera punctata]
RSMGIMFNNYYKLHVAYSFRRDSVYGTVDRRFIHKLIKSDEFASIYTVKLCQFTVPAY